MAEKPDRTKRTPAEERKERLKAALRDNLRRRKAPEGARPASGQGGNTKPASKPET